MFDLNLDRLELGLLRQKEARLRKNERLLSAQIEKLGTQFVKVLNARQITSEKADRLEKQLLEADGRITYIRPRQKKATLRTEKNLNAADIAAVVAMATDQSMSVEERLERALAIIKQA